MPDEPIYAQTAIFSCNCCGYNTTIYSNNEWLEIIEEKVCEKCKRAYNQHFDEGIIYRDDLAEPGEADIPLHPQCASLPDKLQYCNHCNGRSLVHWTELLVHCHRCKSDTMAFNEYTMGANITLLKEWCSNWAKPAHPKMEWEDKKGHTLFVISGWGVDFSAT